MKLFLESYDRISMRVRVRKFLEISLRCFLLLLLPAIFSFIVTSCWNVFLFQKGIHFHDGMEGIVTSGWIPVFGILYGLVATVVFNTVWSEYREMRMAVKRYDMETFMHLRDEEISPLVHAMTLLLSIAVLGAFMGLKYPSAIDGMLVIASTSYLFALLLCVVMEIDNPCSGLWFIKSIHKEWLTLDTKEWREGHWKEKKKSLNVAFETAPCGESE